MADRIEAVVEHITYTKGVIGVVVCTADGVPIRDSFQGLDRKVALTYADTAAELARQASVLCTTNFAAASSPKDSRHSATAPIVPSPLEVIRVRTRNNEMIVQCDSEFLLVVIQEPVD